MTRDEALRFAAHAAKADSLAAKGSAYLAECLPEYSSVLAAQADQEKDHARALARIAGSVTVSPEYAKGILARFVNVQDPTWVAMWLNFIERRSILPFTMAWRVLRHPDIAQIIEDEHRHIKLGTEILRGYGATAGDVAKAAQALGAIDILLDADLRRGLDEINARVQSDLITALEF